VHTRIYNQREVRIRQLALEPAHDRHRGISLIADAEDDLITRMQLPGEAQKVLVQLGVGAAQRLQHRGRRYR
jgi:hypothetical protein